MARPCNIPLRSCRKAFSHYPGQASLNIPYDDGHIQRIADVNHIIPVENMYRECGVQKLDEARAQRYLSVQGNRSRDSRTKLAESSLAVLEDHDTRTNRCRFALQGSRTDYAFLMENCETLGVQDARHGNAHEHKKRAEETLNVSRQRTRG